MCLTSTEEMIYIFKKLSKGWGAHRKFGNQLKIVHKMSKYLVLFLKWIQNCECILLYIWKGTLMNIFAVHVSIIFDQERMTGETRSHVTLLGDIEYKATVV